MGRPQRVIGILAALQARRRTTADVLVAVYREFGLSEGEFDVLAARELIQRLARDVALAHG